MCGVKKPRAALLGAGSSRKLRPVNGAATSATTGTTDADSRASRPAHDQASRSAGRCQHRELRFKTAHDRRRASSARRRRRRQDRREEFDAAVQMASSRRPRASKHRNSAPSISLSPPAQATVADALALKSIDFRHFSSKALRGVRQPGSAPPALQISGSKVRRSLSHRPKSFR